jgi:hypothetical protein
MPRGYKTGGRQKGTPNKVNQYVTPFHLKEYEKRPTVYLIKAHDRYKIGRTINLSKRFFSCAGLSPYPLELIWNLYIDEHAVLEKSLHRIFKDKRIHHEWFSLSTDDVEAIRRITSLQDLYTMGPLFNQYLELQ